VRINEFKMTRNQKRALNSCKHIKMKIGDPVYTEEKFKLYLTHKKRFNSLQDDVEDEQNFRMSFYVNTPFGIEFEYYQDGKLVGVALGDKTSKSFSAIYTFYDVPDKRMSLGTYSVLKQLEYAQQYCMKYFYLGYYISENASLTYKSSFRPNEVYMGREWRRFRNAAGDYLISKKRLQWKNSDLLVKAASTSVTLDSQ
jgi:arginine-tRNA-protein transferase